jgi:hypothetical protein
MVKSAAKEAKARGETTFRGAICHRHPEFDGRRYVNGRCVECWRLFLRDYRRNRVPWREYWASREGVA